MIVRKKFIVVPGQRAALNPASRFSDR